LDTKSLLVVHYSIIHSHLTYCLSSWGSAAVTTLKSLQILQKRVVRTILFKNIRTSSKSLFFQLQFLNINDLYQFEIAKIMHKIHNNSTNLSKCNLFRKTAKIHTHNTRSNSNTDYFIPRIPTSQAQKSLSFSGTKVWNGIPTQIKQLRLHKFKKEFKIKLLSKYTSI